MFGILLLSFFPLIIKIISFWGDLTDIPAKTATLMTTNPESARVSVYAA